MNRAIFLDRDNTLIQNDEDLGDPSQVKLIQGTASAIASLRGLGYRIIVVTNQGGVARGKFGEADVEAVNARTNDLIVQNSGASIDRFYYCPYHPEGTVEKYRCEHPWRKPAPGMLIQAGKDMQLDMSQSWMVGDHMRDVQAGAAAGVRTILLTPQAGAAQPPLLQDRMAAELLKKPGEKPPMMPDFVARNLIEAVRIIAQQRRPEGADDWRTIETSVTSGTARNAATSAAHSHSQPAASKQAAATSAKPAAATTTTTFTNTTVAASVPASQTSAGPVPPVTTLPESPAPVTALPEKPVPAISAPASPSLALPAPVSPAPASPTPVSPASVPPTPTPVAPPQVSTTPVSVPSTSLEIEPSQADDAVHNAPAPTFTAAPTTTTSSTSPTQAATTASTSRVSTPTHSLPAAPASLPVTSSPGIEQTLRQILAELRNQRQPIDEFNYTGTLAIVFQLLAVVCLLAALWMGSTNDGVYFRWMGVSLLTQLIALFMLLFKR